MSKKKNTPKPAAPIYREKVETHPVWQPTWRWHLETLGKIYIGVIILFGVIYFIWKPYIRKLPPEITPWLTKRAQ